MATLSPSQRAARHAASLSDCEARVLRLASCLHGKTVYSAGLNADHAQAMLRLVERGHMVKVSLHGYAITRQGRETEKALR